MTPSNSRKIAKIVEQAVAAATLPVWEWQAERLPYNQGSGPGFAPGCGSARAGLQSKTAEKEKR